MVVNGGVVGRLLARAACGLRRVVLKSRLAGAVGPHQFSVGRAAGSYLVHKCVTALVDDEKLRVVIAFDVVNAFGSLPRQGVWEGVPGWLTELACAARAWLGRPTTYVLWEDEGTAHALAHCRRYCLRWLSRPLWS